MFKECLAKQNISLQEAFGTTDIAVPENGSVVFGMPDGSIKTETIIVCNLEKELENVRKAELENI